MLYDLNWEESRRIKHQLAAMIYLVIKDLVDIPCGRVEKDQTSVCHNDIPGHQRHSGHTLWKSREGSNFSLPQ